MKFLANGKKLEKQGTLIPLALTNHHNNYEQLSVLMSKDKVTQFTTPATIFTLDHSDQLPANMLFDTGALQGDYVSKDLAYKLKSLGALRQGCQINVCGPGGKCQKCLGILNFFIRYLNPINKEYEVIALSCRIINMTFDLIIGRKTLIINDLLVKYAHMFTNAATQASRYIVAKKSGVSDELSPIVQKHASPNEILANMVESLRREENVVNVKEILGDHEDDDESDEFFEQPPWIQDTYKGIQELSHQPSKKKKKRSADISNVHSPNEYEVEEREHLLTDSLDFTSASKQVNDSGTANDLLDLVTFEGSESLQRQLRVLVRKYEDIFSMDLRPTPANIEPMVLEVDNTQWEQPVNRRPARIQSILKENETRRQVDLMLQNKVITPSQASTWSQVLLTPKPNKEWRFCVDYRSLNVATKSIGWPIPNVRQMLQRVGNKRPKIFGICDLTQGYYQAPLAMSSRLLTAFITAFGLYEWLRVPMGLKGAPSYFQRILATVVLAGLIMVICELYIDDVLIYAQSDKEFIQNVEQVFERFRKHNITIKPTKCRLGLSRAEYVGHVLSSEGLTFSKEKKQKVLDFTKPKTYGEMKSFLGLVEYFHSHVRNHSMLIRPLIQIIPNYKDNPKNKVLKWDDEAEKAYVDIQTAIEDSATLFFIDPHGDIHLETDASKYGIGAYLYQMVEVQGKSQKQPVAFISKTLDKGQLKWSTPEKEAYAIFFALKELTYLLRDVHFTLHTDHKNLTYIKESGSEKVYRWKLAIQEYDFDIQYIKGPENVIADAFSRWCKLPIEPEDVGTEHEQEMLATWEEEMYTLKAYEVPEDKRTIIKEFHNSSVGHWGVQKTYDKLRAKGHEWDLMRGHVRHFVKHCPCCQKMSRLKVAIHTRPYTTATYAPFERIAVDTIGPLPIDEDGNKYLIVIIDCFSRYLKLHPAQDATATAAAPALLQFVSTYGQPSQILSDNGPQYVNQLIQELTNMIGIEHVLTMAYSSEENGLVERVNKEVMRHIRNIIFDKRVKKRWSRNYPLVERIFNAEEHGVTKVSPAQIIFGNSVNLDRGVFQPHCVKNREKESLTLWVSEMLQDQENIIKVAKEHQRNSDLHHIAMHTAERTEFPINSYVMAKYENHEHRPPTKLHPIKKGPFRVVNYTGSIYTVQNLVTMKNEDYHVTNLEPYFQDNKHNDPRQAANADADVVDVDEVLDHTGNWKGHKRYLYFKVKWADGEIQDRVSWAQLRDTEALHAYLTSKGQQKLIPKQYTWDP